MNASVERRAGFVAAEALVGWPRRVQCLWLVLMFGVTPLIAALFVPPPGWIPTLWLVAAVGWRWTPGIYGAVGGRHESYGVTAAEIRRVAWRFAIFATLLFLAVLIARPEHLLDWPRHRPFTWLAILVAYPLASVVPQEMLYRGVIFGRIQAFGGSDRSAVWISATTSPPCTSSMATRARSS